MKIQLAWTGLCLILAAGGFVSCRKAQAIDSQFENVKMARDQHGWVPVWIPPLATEIKEIHNAETCAELMVFKYSEDDIGRILKDCHPAPANSFPPPDARLVTQVDWWNPDSQKGFSKEKRFFICESVSETCSKIRNSWQAWLVLDKGTSIGYFWQ